MKESRYQIRELTKETAADAMYIEQLTGYPYRVVDIPDYLDQLDNDAASLVEGSQRGIVVYQNLDPVAYLGIHTPVHSEFLFQTLGGFATDPTRRSLELLQSMLTHVLETQHPGYTYLYHAYAKQDTTYEALKQEGVQRWLGKRGYNVLFSDRAEEDARVQGTARIILYPAKILDDGWYQ